MTPEKASKECRDASERDLFIAERLFQKYQSMRSMRLALNVDDAAVRAQMRALAEKFPGALREIDMLPMETIDSRIDALDDARKGAALPDWARWLDRYHAWLRVAIAVRLVASSDRERTLRDQLRIEALEEHAARSAKLVDEIIKPAGGRMSIWACARVVLEFSADAKQVREIVLPLRNVRLR